MQDLYPSYMDLDPFIDVDRLKALDGFLTERIAARVSQEDTAFYTGPFLLRAEAPAVPGSRMIYLSRSKQPEDYYDLDRPEVWQDSPEADSFEPLMSFIRTLPFETTARMLIMYDPDGRSVSAHRDHDSSELCHEFIWFRTNLNKPFYMLNRDTGKRQDVRSHTAWFDTVNQFHGADGTGALSFSIRVDGRFADSFRRQIPFPATGRAATPSLWAQSIRRAVSC